MSRVEITDAMVDAGADCVQDRAGVWSRDLAASIAREVFVAMTVAASND